MRASREKAVGKMVVSVYLFFGFLIAFTHGVNPNEDQNLGVVNSTADFSAIDQTDQIDQNQQDDNDTMYKAPTFTNKKKMVEGYVKPEGNMVTLKCKSHGIPTPNITWYKNNEEPKRRLGTIRYRSWHISLEDLTIDDSGSYTCVVCNSLGCISHIYTLVVVERYNQRPIITDPPQDRTVAVGSDVSFSCTFLSDLTPYMYWVAGMPPAKDIVKISATTQNPEILELHNVTHESEGWYTCVTANDFGRTFAGAYLTVVDSLEEPSQP